MQDLTLIGAIIVSTFMLEDVAIIAAALLAIAGKIRPELAFMAVCCGIFIGDTGLYLAGRASHIWPWLARRFAHPILQKQVAPLRHASWRQLLWIRAMPGLRTFGYLACGIARINGVKFTLANALSILLWAALLFGILYIFGRQYAQQLEGAIWWFMPAALGIFMLGYWQLRKKIAP